MKAIISIKQFCISFTKFIFIFALLMAVALISNSNSPNEMAGDLDTTFGNGGIVFTQINQTSTLASTMAIQTDGKILAAGSVGQFPNSDFALIRYNTDGSLDTTFGNGGNVVTDIDNLRNEARSVAIQPDGKIVVAGLIAEAFNREKIALVRYNIDGSLDSTFGNQGKVITLIGTYSIASSVAIQNDGKIVVTGVVDGGQEISDFGILRYNSDGSLDNNFGDEGKVITQISDGYDRPSDLGIQVDGKLVVAGTSGGSIAKFALVRYKVDGSLDETFGINGMQTTQIEGYSAMARSLVIQNDGKIILGGEEVNNAYALMRYTNNGILDETFGNSGIVITPNSGVGILYDLVLQNDGKIVAVGEDSINATHEFVLIRYHNNGSLDSSFGVGGKATTSIGEGDDVAIAGGQQQDGKIVAVGQSRLGTNLGFGLARYLTFDCFNSLSSPNQSFSASSGNGSFNVSATSQCTWIAQSNDSWLSVTSGSTGTGNGNVNFAVQANSGPARTGTITAAGQLFTVNQASGCAFSINPISQDFNSTVGNGSFSLTASNAGCSWNAVASDNWFSITSSNSGSGNAVINFTVSANNTTSNRSGMITVGGQTFTINQFAPCAYSFSPTMTNVPSNGEIGVVNVITTQNCNWTASSNAPWITITSDGNGMGSGTVDFAVSANSGPARSGTITLADQIFTINQADGCTISLSLTSANFQANGGNGIFGINTQTGCMWSAETSASWITINQGSGTGIGKVTFTVASNLGSVRTGLISVNGQTFTVNQAARNIVKSAFDFDGDGKSDIGIFRPSVGEWWYLRSSDGGNRAFQFGQSTDKIVAADYTGDGKADIAFFRPSSGEWFILRSEDSSFYAFLFGNSDDIPTPADFDGDGKTDPAIYRPSNQTWYIIRSSDNQTTIQQFGAPGDLPVAADYDGDNKADLAIYRSSNGQWWVNRTQAGLIVATFGTSSDRTVQADYTGDGKADIAFFRPSSGEWFVLRSEDFSFYSAPFGASGDIPTPGDYDGDGKSDFAIFRSSTNTWYLQQSSSGFTAVTFGTTNDIPIHNAYVR